MSETQIYKKFLLQKKVLDTLRTFLELNDTLFYELKTRGIISENESLEVEKLQWPRNRNELLQCLVRKSWSLEQLNTFYQCMQISQKAQVMEILVTERQSYIEEVGEETFKSGSVKKATTDAQPSNTERRSSPSTNNLINNDLDRILKKTLSVKDQNMIRSLLNDRDKEIFQLKLENQELRKQIKESVTENTLIKHRMHTLDKATSDLLACVDWDVDQSSVELGLAEVKSTLTFLQQTVKDLKEEIQKNHDETQDLRSRMAVIIADNKTLRDLNESLTSKMKKVEKGREDVTSDLATQLAAEKQRADKTKDRLEMMEKRYRSAIETLQEQITFLKTELTEAHQQLKLSDEDNAKHKNLLNQVNDKTRKLLVSLNLDNDVSDTSVALDFARNVSYTRRRASNPAPSNSSRVISQSLANPNNNINRKQHGVSNGQSASGVLPANLPFDNAKMAVSPRTSVLPRRASVTNTLGVSLRNGDSTKSSTNDLSTIGENVEIENVYPLLQKT